MKESQEAKLFALYNLRKAMVHGKTENKVWLSVCIRRTQVLARLHIARFIHNLNIFVTMHIHIQNSEFSIWKVNSN